MLQIIVWTRTKVAKAHGLSTPPLMSTPQRFAITSAVNPSLKPFEVKPCSLARPNVGRFWAFNIFQCPRSIRRIMALEGKSTLLGYLTTKESWHKHNCFWQPALHKGFGPISISRRCILITDHSWGTFQGASRITPEKKTWRKYELLQCVFFLKSLFHYSDRTGTTWCWSFHGGLKLLHRNLSLDQIWIPSDQALILIYNVFLYHLYQCSFDKEQPTLIATVDTSSCFFVKHCQISCVGAESRHSWSAAYSRQRRRGEAQRGSAVSWVLVNQCNFVKLR